MMWLEVTGPFQNSINLFPKFGGPAFSLFFLSLFFFFSLRFYLLTQIKMLFCSFLFLKKKKKI